MSKRGARRPIPTIEQIRDYEWAGNHASDSGKMAAIRAYVEAVHEADPGSAKEAVTS